MAKARRLSTLKYISSLLLNPIPQYTGQMSPDNYCDMIIQAWAPAVPNMVALENANANDFNDAVKVKIMKGKMTGKYTPVPANNGLVAGNPAINSPNTLRAWMRAKYQRETVGNQQSAIQRLTQERYQLYCSMLEIEAFINKELLANLPQNHDYHANINMHITRVNNTFGDEYEALKRSYATGTSKSQKCSNCEKSGHTKESYPKFKKGKKKKKTNYARNSSSSSESSSSDSSDLDSSHTCYGLKKKNSENKHSGKKVKDKKKSHTDRRLIIFEVFQLLLKALVQSFINSVLKETVISVYNALNAEFINYKKLILNQLKGSPSIKTREKIWDSIKKLFTVILQPMIGIVSSNMAANLIHKNEESGSVHVDDGLWMPAGIGVVNHKSASDVVTIKTKVVVPKSEKSLVIPITIFDTGSDSSLISNNIVKRLDLTVDRSNALNLSGIATKSDTIGTVYGLGILVYDGENTKKIEDDFMVVKSDKDFLLLGVPWIDHANAILDFQSWQLTIPLTQHIKVTIPISLHKWKTNVTSLNIDSIDIKKICILETD
jgi:hypothetical protein